MPFKKTLLAGAAILSGFIALPSAFAADAKASAEMPRQEQHAVDNAQPARVADQIKELHDKLRITAAQEDKWSDVAEAMTATAKDVRTKLTDRAEKVKTSSLTAVDELRSYQDLQQVQYEGVKRLVGPFSTLYASMSPEQMKNADEIFEEPREEAEASGGASHKHMHKSQ
jgi:hypothetical protein